MQWKTPNRDGEKTKEKKRTMKKQNDFKNIHAKYIDVNTKT